MNYLHHPHSPLRCLMLALALSLLGLSAQAQERTSLKASFETNTNQPVKIDVLVGQSRVIDFDEAIERVSVSGEKIVEAVPITPKQVLINGLAFGQVNLVVWNKRPDLPENAPATATRGDAKMIVFDIYVQANISLIDNQIKVLFPKENIQLSQAQGSIVLSGSVTNPEMSKQAQAIIEAAGFKDKVVNMLRVPVNDAVQVQLQIRVAEVNRKIMRELGTAYGIVNSTVPTFINSGGPGAAAGAVDLVHGNPFLTAASTSALNLMLGNVGGGLAFIRALQSRGALRDLAEPNLIAMNGSEANFLAGGEFPVPIIQSVSTGQNAITVIFKEFGVRLSFKPKVIDENHIQLELAPEVSSLDFGSGVQVQGLVIPGLRVRRAKTMLELRDGQSFALAGLIDNTEQVNLSKIPLLGNIPIIGELFKSRSFQRNETELMFLVTVKLVEPLNPDQVPTLPGAADLNRGKIAPSQDNIEGQSGHSVKGKGGEPTPETAPKQLEPAAKPTDSTPAQPETAKQPEPTTKAPESPTAKPETATAKTEPVTAKANKPPVK